VEFDTLFFLKYLLTPLSKLMKTPLPILLLLMLLYSCSTDTTQETIAPPISIPSKPGKVKISGTIDYFEKYPNLTTVQAFPDVIGPILKKQTIIDTLDQKGHFSLIFEIDQPQFIKFHYGKSITLFVEPETNIDLQIPADFFVTISNPYGSVTVNYDNTEVNESLLEFNRTYINRFSFADRQVQMRNLFVDEFIALAKNQKETQLAYLDSLLQTKKVINPIFANWAHQKIIYTYGTYLIQYPAYNTQYINTQDLGVELPEYYFNFLENEVPLDNKAAMEHPYYQRFLSSYLGYLLTHLKNKKTYQNCAKQSDCSTFELEVNHLMDQTKGLHQDILLTNHFGQALDINQYDQAKPYLDLYFKTVKENKLSNLIKDKIATDYGSSDPTLAFANGTSFHQTELNDSTLLEHILKKNKGNITCLLFWKAANFDPPSTRRDYPIDWIPKAMKKTKGVTYTFLAHDSPDRKWKRKISEQQLAGQHYNLSQSQVEALAPALDSEYRRLSHGWYYFVFDQQGVPVKTWFVNSEEKLLKLLQGLLLQLLFNVN